MVALLARAEGSKEWKGEKKARRGGGLDKGGEKTAMFEREKTAMFELVWPG
jgi:hypothetical protein